MIDTTVVTFYEKYSDESGKQHFTVSQYDRKTGIVNRLTDYFKNANKGLKNSARA